MSDTSRLLSELESAAIAGVSVDTIRQFRGCGLLEPVREDGKERFREIDIKTLFYNRTKQANTPAPEPISFEDRQEGSEVDREETVEESVTKAEDAAAPGIPYDSPPHNSQISTDPLAQTETVSSTADSGATEDGLTRDEAGRRPEDSASLLPVLSTISTDHLIETNKGLREQLEILRGERDWLRARVEKLETRSEREQMLLLSESENIRKLIQQGEQKRTSWLRALPWFGK